MAEPVRVGAKAEARAQARAARRAIPDAEREELSRRIGERLLALPELRAVKSVGCYASVGSEVGTGLVLRGFLARGVRVSVPVVDGERLRFVRLQHPWALVPGARGLPEPRQPWEEVEPSGLEAVVVPGLRFGRDGSRLGQGGGHFDRFLSQNPAARRVACAFSAQVVDRVEVEGHDEGMDVLVTEAEVLRFVRRPADRPGTG